MDEINCDFKFTKNISKYGRNIRFVNIYDAKNKKYVIKKEYPPKDNIMKEYIFFKKYSEQIIKDKLDKNINIPLKIMNCSNNGVLYIFNYIENDYNKKYIKRISYMQWIDYTIQLCLLIYYLNYSLNIYHNDLSNYGDMNNIMIKQNNKPFTINIDDFTYTINNNYIVIIDFGAQDNKISYRSENFYNNKYKNNNNNYKYKSEIFMMFYYSYVLFFNISR